MWNLNAERQSTINSRTYFSYVHDDKYKSNVFSDYEHISPHFDTKAQKRSVAWHQKSVSGIG